MLQEELLIESKNLNKFIKFAQGVITTNSSPTILISQLTQPFTDLLSEDFIPKYFMKETHITFAQYLIYRSFSPEFSLMAMLVPPGVSTPVHDHLAWGLVGVYQGEQEDTIYTSTRKSSSSGITPTGTNLLEKGTITVIVPPNNDIHMIKTISSVPSISLHLLGNDIGCQHRHTYDPINGTPTSFRSVYVNAACDQPS